MRFSSIVSSYLVFGMLLLSGCGNVYKEPKLAEDQCAIISFSYPLGVRYVDDKFCINDLFTPAVNGKWRVAMTPGKHILKVEYDVHYEYASAYLWIVAYPGERYVLKHHEDEWSLRVSLWIEDERTGMRVGGIKGSEDEPPDGADATMADKSPKIKNMIE